MNGRKPVLAGFMILLLIGLSTFASTEYVAGYQPQRSATPTYSESPNDIVFQTGILASIVDKDQPAITFYYQPDGGTVGKFRITYNSIIGYNDTGNGIFEEDEAVYQGILSSGAWNSSPILSLEDGQHGRYLVFSMNSSITMTPVGPGQGGGDHGEPPRAPILDWATAVLTFMVTEESYNRTVSSQYVYQISGDSELKVDISLVIHEALPAENITIEQFLYENEDMRQDHVFLLHESTGVVQASSRNRQSGPHGLLMYRFNYAAQLEQRIAFSSSESIEEGYYSWIAPVNLTRAGEIESLTNATASYTMSGTELRLYCSFPYFPDYDNVHFDPTIGIVVEGFLEAIARFIAEHVYSLVLGVVVGTVIVIGVLYFTSERETKKEADITDLRQNPYYSEQEQDLWQINSVLTLTFFSKLF